MRKNIQKRHASSEKKREILNSANLQPSEEVGQFVEF